MKNLCRRLPPFPIVTLVLLAVACSVHRPYPKSWPAPTAPSAPDCHDIEGVFRDRGEMPGKSARPSLSLEIFGYHSQWATATRVAFSLPDPSTMDVVVSGPNGELFRRSLTTESGQFECEAGRAVLHDQRWVAADAVFGRESVVLTLSSSEDQLLVHARQRTAGAIFLVIPIVGTTSSWYRFERLRDEPEPRNHDG